MQLPRLAALACAALVATTMATTADAAPAHHAHATQQIVVRPVNTHGHVASGFTRKDVNFRVDCAPHHPSASTVAVDRHIFYCSPSVADALACWAAGRAKHVLCFENAFKQEVVRFRGTAPAHVKKPSQPYNALNLVLANGERCYARDGGAVGVQKQHPNWFAAYYCGHDDILWSSSRLGDTEGTNRSQPRWTAWVGTTNGPLHKRAVTKAFLVGTKH
jgi:hypothetical protein